MVDKIQLKECLNDRLKYIDMFVDNIIPNDYINIIIKKYKKELLDYTYIDSIAMFSTLKLKGSMRYINKYDKKLRLGGLLVKIYQKNGKWIGVIKQHDKKYYISFDSNYIFYLDTKQELVRDWAECFISNCDKGLYEIE